MSSKISIGGLAFMAYATNVKNRDINELKNEEKQDKATTASQNKQIIFTDQISNKNVSIELSSENFAKLKDNFYDSDFYKREDGSIRLNGKAESYVAGWYEDIAYHREFLKADVNKDGNLDNAEYLNTKNDFDAKTFLYHKTDKDTKETVATGAIEYIVKAYTSVGGSKHEDIARYSGAYSANTIEDELNTTLKLDRNLDSKMTLDEALKSKNSNEINSDEDIVINQVAKSTNQEKVYFGSSQKKSNALFDQRSVQEIFDDAAQKLQKQKNQESISGKDDKKLQEEALQKLKSANGDISVLTSDEKQALQGQLSQITAEIGSSGNLNILI